MSNGERYLWRIVFKNFLNSLRPRPLGNSIGKDYKGNIYYEIPANPQLGKRKATRWYDPPKGLDFQEPIPSEWESWLRMRRVDPPSEEEIAKNLAVANLKKINAARIEEERLKDGGLLPTPIERGAQSFPTYSEYHTGDPTTNPKK
ncbi:hypothetical protein ACJJTC_012722 [Scirpophaga incertulas]